MSKIDGSYPGGFNPAQEFEAQVATEFITKWDGTQPELTEADMEQAAMIFEQLVETKFMTYADFTSGALATHLGLEKTYDDGSVATVTIMTSTAMNLKGKILLSQLDSAGDFREQFDYELSPDGKAVRRYDMGDSQARAVNDEPPLMRMYTVEKGVTVADDDGAKNFELAQQMGLNNQSVSAAEVNALATLLNDMWPRPSSGGYFESRRSG